MARAALQRRKLDAASLGVQTACNGVCQEACRAGQSLVAERIHRVDIVGQLADIAAILELDASDTAMTMDGFSFCIRSTFSTK